MGVLLRTTDATGVIGDVLSALRAADDIDPRLLPVVQTLVSQRAGDPAALAPLLLSVVELTPGEAMFCAAGQPHTYLSGLGFEVQANSDEVVRGGLTDKPVNVTAFVDALDTRVGGARVAARPDGPEDVFDPPEGAFSLGVVRQVDGSLPHVSGPQIWLCLEGGFRLADADGHTVLGRGDAAFSPGTTAPLSAVGGGLLLRVGGRRAG
jgi:mannose-6-phosphate isomerase